MQVWMVHRYAPHTGYGKEHNRRSYMHTVETVFETKSAAELWIARQNERLGVYGTLPIHCLSEADTNVMFPASN